MKTEWVKRMLLRKGAHAALHDCSTPHRRRAASFIVDDDVAAPSQTASTPRKQSAYVIAEKMEPLGCACLLVGRRKQKPSSSAPASLRCRVVLPGILPGTVLRTRASVVEWIHRFRQLPASTEYTLLMRSGKRVPRYAADTGLRALPCGLAAASACQRCPWMAGGSGGESTTAKHASWRASLQNAVSNWWASSATADGTASQALTHDDAMRCCSFLEPFTVQVTLNRLLGLQLFFVPRERTDSPASSHGRPGDPAGCVCGTTASATAVVCVEREGVSHPPLVAAEVRYGESASSAAASGGARGLPPAVPNWEQECLLESLEQKRLVPALRRWAARLPTSTQERLLGVLISQPAMWSRSAVMTMTLQVTLVVERNTDVLDMQSPLCSPSHPADLLSTEEQQLVEVVTTAAPLIHEIEVLVWVQSALSESQRASAGEAALHRLYPTLSRTASLAYAHSEAWRKGSDSFKKTEAHELQRGQAAQTVRCWCHLLSRELSVPVTPYHAALWAVSPKWLSEARRRRTQPRHSTAHHTMASRVPENAHTTAPAAARSFSGSCAQRFPWVPTFWRHPGALDACCSVLLSLALGDSTLPTGTTSTATESGAPLHQGRVEVHVPRVSEHALASVEADVGAAAGQTILDAAVVALAREAERALVLREKSAKIVHLSSSAEMLPPVPLASTFTFRRVLVSVREGDEAAVAETTAFVKEVLRTAGARPVRLCFYGCTSTMKTSSLGAQVAATLHHAKLVGPSVSVDTGVVDVDPLASSFVAYACVDLHM
ncbi:hypothetical protein LSCM1_02005 [Leishmania martiniquensis]|uniref:Uncharacterized protein n=1 Tax=Leishmania martiniquensis TaxID=1580590 RepID=A0A836H4I9_9TRYP|nr:hypothetical protein LSCM1_02005 [Leishmania martiniquensis]